MGAETGATKRSTSSLCRSKTQIRNVREIQGRDVSAGCLSIGSREHSLSVTQRWPASNHELAETKHNSAFSQNDDARGNNHYIFKELAWSRVVFSLNECSPPVSKAQVVTVHRSKKSSRGPSVSALATVNKLFVVTKALWQNYTFCSIIKKKVIKIS